MEAKSEGDKQRESVTQSEASSGTVNPEDDETLKLPRSAFHIICVEGCERFTYYGLRTVLLLYFIHYLRLDKDSATVAYHLFSFTYFLTPTLGAILSDGFIGSYLTIVILGLVYFVGTVILAITAVPQIGHQHLSGPFVGLLLIGIGAGGLKPCVNTFGADQISSSSLNRYFSYFYIWINAGALASTVITPLLRSDVQCFGYNCYPLAFGVPSLLMLIALIVFVSGTPLYKNESPKENAVFRFIGLISRAIRNAIFSRTAEPRKHWLHYAHDKYAVEDIEDVRRVLHVALLFVPISVFQALNNQQGSRWTYQASLMNGSLGPLGTIQPDQMQAISNLLVLLFVPLFDIVIYPRAARHHWLTKPLERVFAGMITMALAFLAATILQSAIASRATAVPVRYHTQIYSDYQCPVTMNYNVTVPKQQMHRFRCGSLLQHELRVASTCDRSVACFNLSADKMCPSLLIVSNREELGNRRGMKLTPFTNPISQTRGADNYALLRLIALDKANGTFKLLPNQYTYNVSKPLLPTDYQSVLQYRYHVENTINGRTSVNSFGVLTTGVYTVLLVDTKSAKFRTILVEDVAPYTVHILWQTIQYVLLTGAEVLVSLTCIIFAYSQAPKRYKVVIMSAWLLTSALGDLLVVVIAKVHLIPNQTLEFLFFTCLMVGAAVVFRTIGMHYREAPVDGHSSEEQPLIAE